MSDAATPTALAQTAGQRLRAVREAKGMSREDVAQAIKYAPRQIEALEADDYAALPALAVVRGMVRSYAKLLGLESEPLLGQLRPVDAAGAPTVTVHSIQVPFPAKSSTGSRWIWGVLALLLLAIGAFAIEQYMATRERAPSGAGGPGLNVAPLSTTPQTQSVPDGSQPSSGGDASAAPADAAPPPPAPPVSATKKIEMQFTRDSWVEVRAGAEANVVHNRLNPAGSKITIEDKPPFKLVIGAASGVKLVYDGKLVDLAPNTQVDVARVSLD